MLRSGMSLPSTVWCVQRCWITVSARVFIIATIQSPAFSACGVPGTRGPKATCSRAYDSAESPTKAVLARDGRRSHAASAGSAARASRSIRASGILIVLWSSAVVDASALLRVAEELDLQHGGQHELRVPPIEVVVVRHQTRPLEGEDERLTQVGVGVHAERRASVVGQPARADACGVGDVRARARLLIPDTRADVALVGEAEIL